MRAPGDGLDRAHDLAGRHVDHLQTVAVRHIDPLAGGIEHHIVPPVGRAERNGLVQAIAGGRGLGPCARGAERQRGQADGCDETKRLHGWPFQRRR